VLNPLACTQRTRCRSGWAF